MILERRRVFAAMGRSVELTRSHFWHVLGVVLTASLLGALLNVALATGLNVWSTHGGSPTSLVIAQGIANTIASLITTPFVAAAIVTLYFDLRIRDEAFDVQMAMRPMRRPRPPSIPMPTRRGCRARHPLRPPVPVGARHRARCASR